MEYPRITLAIYGNQYSNGGFQPLYWINSPVQQLANPIPPGMGDNPYFFVVQTGSRFTQFTLVENHVSSCDGFRAGVLKIAIGIPNDFRLDNDMSPMDLLLDIRRTFVSECMTQKSTLSLTRNFKEELPDDKVFKDIIEHYLLAPAYDTVYPMHGSDQAVILLDKHQTAAFFKNVHFPELAEYKEVVVGATGHLENYSKVIKDLNIPRPFTPPPVNTTPPTAPISIPVEAPREEQSTYGQPVYLPVEKKPGLILPFIQFVVVPLFAFLFGFGCVFIAHLIIH